MARLWLVIVAIGLSFSAGPAAFVADVDAKTLARPTVVVVAPLSGDAAPVGEQLLNAARLAASEYDLTIESIDEEEGVADVGRQLARLAERADVVAVVGPMRRRNARPLAQRTQALGLPSLIFSSTTGVEHIGGAIFRARLSAEEQAAQLLDYADDELELQRLALLAPETDYGGELVRHLVDEARRREVVVAALVQYDEGTTDFAPALETLMGKRAAVGRNRRVGDRRADRWGTIALNREGSVDFDGLIIADHHSTVARMLPFLSRVGISTAADEGTSVQLLGLSGWRGDGLALAGQRAKGAIFFDTFGGADDGNRALEVVSHFRAELDSDPTTPEVELYDLIGMVATALEGADSYEDWRASVAAYLYSDNAYEGAAGTWRFDAAGAPNRRLSPFLVIDNGQWVRDDEGRR